MNTSTESPTSTIKRNHQKLNHNNNNNNNQRSLKTKNQPINSPYDQIVSPSTNSFIIGNIGATSSGFPGDDEEGSDIIHILRNDTMIGAGPGAGTDSGTATTRSTKLRTLPPIGSRNQAGVYATDVDLVVGSSGTGGGIARRPSVADKTNAMGTAPNSGGQRIQRAGGSTFTDGMDYHLGLIGWRKKCLYSLLFMLMLLIIVNLVLTLWILKVMEFSSEGMGQLKIVPGGIQLTGQALFMDLLRASNIRSRHGQPISIESSRNFSINTRDANGILENHLFLGHDKLECLSTEFRINDTTGRNLFSVNRDEVTIGAHALRIDGEGGAIFRESIQTPHVRAEAGRDLRFESPTRQLEMSAAKDITLQSRGGSIEVSALEDIKLSALDGSIRFDSSKIMMPNLRTVQPSTPGTGPNHDHQHRVFQLCACANGKLFLASAHSICAGDDETICR